MSVIGNLIDLIFDNIYIVIAALFFIFKLFGNSSSKNKPAGMPTFGGDPGQPTKQWDDDEDDSSNYEYEQEQQRRQQELERQRQLEQEEADRRRREEASMRAQRAPVTPSYEEVIREQQRKNALAELMKSQNSKQSLRNSGNASAPRAIQVQRSDLQKAVIWSEILGQPRAKRPHRR